MRYYKFVNWDVAPVETHFNNKTVNAMQEYDNGNEKPLKDLEIATTEPYIKIGGWLFDLKPYLKKYWVKTKYYGILEYYAMNKTAIRKELKSYCIKIVEV